MSITKGGGIIISKAIPGALAPMNSRNYKKWRPPTICSRTRPLVDAPRAQAVALASPVAVAATVTPGCNNKCARSWFAAVCVCVCLRSTTIRPAQDYCRSVPMVGAHKFGVPIKMISLSLPCTHRQAFSIDNGKHSVLTMMLPW